MSKMYKYTSLSSAIKIIKSGKVLLNKPSKFNDPFDCAFSSDEKDEKNSLNLLFNYSAIKMVFDLVNNEKLVLTKKQKTIFDVIRFEFKIIKKLLNINPYYSKIPIINGFVNSIIKSKPELKIDLDQIGETFKKTIHEKIGDIKDNTLISCFSKRNDSILMWSHYADSHRGVCLEFETPNQKEFAEVEYTNKRPTIKMYNLFSTYIAHDFIGKPIEAEGFKYAKDLIKPFFVKSTDWSYEEEIRCLFSTKTYKKDRISYDGENYFVNVGKINKIFIGSKAKGPNVDEIIKLAEHRGIDVVFMKESDKEFKVVPNLNYVHKKSEIEKEEIVSILRIIKEIEKSLANELYISAFALALNIPAICGAKAYPNAVEKEQYKKWVNEQYCQNRKSPSVYIDRLPYESAELLYDIRNKFFNNGTFNINKNYDEFKLDRFILRFESKKPFNIYIGSSSVLCDGSMSEKGVLTINVRDFCLSLMELGEKFYRDNEIMFNEKDNIIIENYDKALDEYNEILVFNNHIRGY